MILKWENVNRVWKKKCNQINLVCLCIVVKCLPMNADLLYLQVRKVLLVCSPCLYRDNDNKSGDCGNLDSDKAGCEFDKRCLG